MKHIFSVLLSIFLLSPLCMKAADLGALQPDVAYSIPEYQEVKATFTPSTSGPVRFLWTCNPLPLYSSADHSESSLVSGDHTYVSGGQLMSYSSLEAGHTYYIYSSMTVMGGSLTITEGDASLEFVGCEPAAGSVFSISRNYRINVSFNFPVSVGDCFLVVGDESVKLNHMAGGSTLTFSVNEAIMSLYHDGNIKEGDTLTLRILQIKDAANPDNLFGGDGSLELNFTMAAKPAELVETIGYSQNSANNQLNSYYLPGDEAALMQLVFDTALSVDSRPVAQLSYGVPDNLELGVYTEDIPGVIDGNKVSFDFSGKLRRRIDMLPGADPDMLPNSLYVSYGGIHSADGQIAYTGMLSNPTGFAASYLINELQYIVAADFLPARGSSLQPGDQMEIWVMNGSKISFDDICIDCILDGKPVTVVVPGESIAASVDPESLAGDDMLFNFTLPEFSADAGSEMYLYMKGIVCADGLDHSGDVCGNFLSGLSSVGSIAPEDDRADVFSIDGRLIIRDASLSDLRNLPAGLYLRSGRKFTVR